MDEQPTTHHSVDADEAARALDAIACTRREVARRAGSPAHYYTKLAVATALITGAQPFGTAIEGAAALVGVALILWAVRSYSEHTGNWTMATLREPGAWMAWLIIGVMVAAMTAAMFTSNLVVSLVGAAAILLIVPVFGPKWDAAWVRSLTAGDDA